VDLDTDSRRRLESNPLRILDSKNPDMQHVIGNAPRLPDFLDADSQAHFAGLLALLDAAGVACTLNPRLVRGLDYYSNTVFEWVTDRLGAQGTICAGGRYDGLVEYLGGRAIPAVGFALGLERLIALLEATGKPLPDGNPHVYLVLGGEQGIRRGMVFAAQLRARLAGLRLQTNCGDGSFKSQFKRADRSGAGIALVIGDDEARQGLVTVKRLRAGAEQETLPEAAVARRLADLLALETPAGD
jgi:histidyl-tRNA synthetase